MLIVDKKCCVPVGTGQTCSKLHEKMGLNTLIKR